jgi:hypothetical protein
MEVNRHITRMAGVDRAYQPHRGRPRSAGRGRLVALDQDGCVVLEVNGKHLFVPKARIDALVEVE